jgi:predicted small metal-binding protein
VPEEVRKAFKEHMKAREEKEVQDLLACYVKDRHGSITQIKEPVLPPIDSTKVVYTAKVPDLSTSVTPEDVSAMFFEHVKFTRNMVGEELAKGLAQFSQNSKYQPTTFATTHPSSPSSSATPSTSVTQLAFGMPLNYFSEQTPLTHNASMTLYTPKPVPISSIPPTLAIPGHASIMPRIAPMGAGSNNATRVRYAAPHAPLTDRLNETTARIWVGVEGRLRDMGISPISHRIYEK